MNLHLLKIIYSSVATLWFLILYFYADSSLIEIGLIVFAVELILFFISNNKNPLTTNYTNPSYCVLFGLLIVGLQNTINDYLGFGRVTDYSVVSNTLSVYAPSVYITLTGLSTYLLTLLVFKPKIAFLQKGSSKSPVLPWVFLTTFSFFGFISTANMADILTGKEYAQDISANSSVYFEGILNNFIIITLSVVAITKQNRNKKVKLLSFAKEFPLLFWIVVGLYIAIRSVSGDRGPLIYTIAAIFFASIYFTGIRIKPLTLVMALSLAAFIITIIGIARLSSLEMTFGERIGQAVNDRIEGNINSVKSISPYTQELANSSQCLMIAMEGQKSGDIDYQHGRFTFYNIISAIPFAGYFMKNIVGTDMSMVSSSSYVTKRGLGPNPTYGLGTSASADFYLEFGWIGVVIGFISVGIIYRFIDYIFFYRVKISTALFVFCLQASSLAIYLCRYSLSGILYRALGTVIIFCIFNFIFKQLKK